MQKPKVMKLCFPGRRYALLITVSVLALLVLVGAAGDAFSEDSGSAGTVGDETQHTENDLNIDRSQMDSEEGHRQSGEPEGDSEENEVVEGEEEGQGDHMEPEDEDADDEGLKELAARLKKRSEASESEAAAAESEAEKLARKVLCPLKPLSVLLFMLSGSCVKPHPSGACCRLKTVCLSLSHS